jgi:UDP-N-acetylmuramate dehydrogenase
VSIGDFEKLRSQWPEIPSYPAAEGKIKIPAGWLIEKTGWKGFKQARCGVHEKQALVLVNYGGATGTEILQLAEDIIRDVHSKTGITLHAEVNVC